MKQFVLFHQSVAAFVFAEFVFKLAARALAFPVHPAASAKPLPFYAALADWRAGLFRALRNLPGLRLRIRHGRNVRC